jgi:transposase-like protein
MTTHKCHMTVIALKHNYANLVIMRCPRCGSDAFNRYGRTLAGKQRFICLVCRRQFVGSPTRSPVSVRPLCPVCGRPMHGYMKSPQGMRFRCSDYPACRTFKTVEEDH